ncbi:hypothetical protein [Limnoglobus roseus]|uniref:Permuted papain-like amidase YaeF/Yiix C92 family enzyme n=1 Tax=Limnoglobus roseus TaxID=2598579 RepID=A0A5C1AAN3_9BACT|nr:hypothetical protein [Limnoglobus roseus]QEL16449.1 hypothetical protein PX52LOC_03403 [Limnoglobus roseus]
MLTCAFLLALTSAAPPASTGYVYAPAAAIDYQLRFPARAYAPQPGDLYLATEDWFIPRFGHLLGHSGAPHHSGIVFARPDGRLALLEAGPDSTLYIRTLDLIPQMTHYADTKRVWMRERAVPLTADQSARLTAFALAADGRHFAGLRMFKEGTIFRMKGPVRTPLFGRPFAVNFDPANPEPSMRRKYFCAELVTEACVAAGLFDPETSRPTSMYPRELFYGTSRIPYLRQHLDLKGWCPPARWTPTVGVQPDIRRRPFIDGDDGSMRRQP